MSFHDVSRTVADKAVNLSCTAAAVPYGGLDSRGAIVKDMWYSRIGWSVQDPNKRSMSTRCLKIWVWGSSANCSQRLVTLSGFSSCEMKDNAKVECENVGDLMGIKCNSTLPWYNFSKNWFNSAHCYKFLSACTSSYSYRSCVTRYWDDSENALVSLWMTCLFNRAKTYECDTSHGDTLQVYVDPIFC